MRLAISLSLVVAAALFAQQRPAFEVAAIKPLGGFVNTRATISGPRITLSGIGLEGLIMDAYQVESWQLVGGPPWRDTAPWEIVAKAPGDELPSPEQRRLMFQALLEDRFGLRVHRESKEGPVYALVVARSGPKFKPSTARDPYFSAGGGRAVRLTFQHHNMEFLAHQLPIRQLGRPVIDKTGLTGDYDFDLNFMPGTPLADSPDPDIFTALQEQLGLKLEPQKGTVETLVIDHAEKPSPN